MKVDDGRISEVNSGQIGFSYVRPNWFGLWKWVFSPTIIILKSFFSKKIQFCYKQGIVSYLMLDYFIPLKFQWTFKCSLSVLNTRWLNILFLLPQTIWIISSKTQGRVYNSLRGCQNCIAAWTPIFRNFSATSLKIMKNMVRQWVSSLFWQRYLSFRVILIRVLCYHMWKFLFSWLERDSLFIYPLRVMIWYHKDVTLHSNELVYEVLSRCHIYIFSTSHWKSISVGMSCIFARSEALST